MRYGRFRLSIVALVGALALILGAAACGDDDGGGGDQADELRESGDREETDEATDDEETDDEETDDEETDDEDEDRGGGLDEGLREQLEDESQSADEAQDEAADEDFVVEEYEDYVTVTDDLGVVAVDVPLEWADVDGAIGLDTNLDLVPDLGSGVQASPDLASYNNTWGTPGVFVIGSSQVTNTLGEAVAVLSEASFAAFDCEPGEVTDYDDGYYTGIYQIFSSCGDTETEYTIIAALDPDETHMILVGFQLVSEADIDALEEVVSSFIVTGTLPS